MPLLWYNMSTTTFIGQSIVNITLLTSFFATLIAFLFEFQFKLHFWWLSGAILIFNCTMPIVFRGSFAEDQSKLKVFILFLCCYALVEKGNSWSFFRYAAAVILTCSSYCSVVWFRVHHRLEHVTGGLLFIHLDHSLHRSFPRILARSLHVLDTRYGQDGIAELIYDLLGDHPQCRRLQRKSSNTEITTLPNPTFRFRCRQH